MKQDAEALQQFLADDLQYAHAGGQTQNKEQYIAAVTQGARQIRVLHVQRSQGTFLRDAAVLTGFVDVKMTGPGILPSPNTPGLYSERRSLANGCPSVYAHKSKVRNAACLSRRQTAGRNIFRRFPLRLETVSTVIHSRFRRVQKRAPQVDRPSKGRQAL